MDIRLQGTFRLLSPLSHIGESISATSYLVQEPVIQPGGGVEQIFVYSGNAWRGQLRDLAAEYMLDALGRPRLPLDTFHMLFAGGRIGGEQSTNIEQARRMRRAIPLMAVWGGGVGNQILPGKLRVRNAYPLVEEALPVLPRQHHEAASRTRYADVTFEKSFSRMDDSRDARVADARLLAAPVAVSQGALMAPADAPPGKVAKEPPPEQMRMTVELVAAGTVLATAIDVLDCSEVELGCLVSALHRFARSPHIGGQANRGHGLVELEYGLVRLDAAERVAEEFVIVEGDGLPPRLGAAASGAKAAYDAHLEEMYAAYLTENASEVRGLLGVAK